MKLLRVFNQNFLGVLRILNKSFGDVESLSALYEETRATLDNDECCVSIHEQFAEEITQSVMDKIFDRDASVIEKGGGSVTFVRRCGLCDIYARMYEAERGVLWENLQALCRYSSMLRACGNQLSEMESLAVDFMKENTNTAPGEYHMKLFHEMLSGGAMSQKLLSTFNDPACIKNILGNVGNIMKSGKREGDEEGDMVDISNLMNMPFTDGDFVDITAGVRGMFPKKKNDGSKHMEVKGGDPDSTVDATAKDTERNEEKEKDTTGDGADLPSLVNSLPFAGGDIESIANGVRDMLLLSRNGGGKDDAQDNNHTTVHDRMVKGGDGGADGMVKNIQDISDLPFADEDFTNIANGVRDMLLSRSVGGKENDTQDSKHVGG